VSEDPAVAADASDRPQPLAGCVSIVGTLLGFALPAGVAAVAVFGLIAIYPDDVVEPDDANFLDNIFANRFVLFAARLVLFSAALVSFFAAFFAILSVIQWMKNGQWLRRAGPFEVDASARTAVNTLDEQLDFWRGEAEAAGEEIGELRERLQEADSLVEKLYEQVTVLEGEKDELQAELQRRPG
jgi:hypothetical protein